MTRRPTLLVASAAALVLLAAACGLDLPDAATTTTTRPSTTSTTRSTTTTTTAPAAARVPDLEWKPCGDELECADADVPLDHDDPTGPTTSIAVVRAPAREQDQRHGALFVNPGGPGGSAIGLASSAAGFLPAAIRDRLDIVGFDPRGVGGSDALSCTDGVKAMYQADPTVEDTTDRQRLIDTSQAFIDTCTDGREDLIAHAGTDTAARDMDLLRQAMGDEQISFLGYSYGTAIGQVYADLFPDHVRAMVLDGVVDLTAPGVEGAQVQAEGFEHALERFAASCQNDGSCPIGPDPIAVVEEVMQAAERAAIPAAGQDRPAGPGEVTLALAQALYSTNGWDDLAAALDHARSGDGAGLVDLADTYLGVADFGAYFAVNCLDARWPDVDGLLAAAERAGRAAPHFGEAIVNDYLRCSLWPVPPDPVPAPSTGDSLPPILVISTVGDPATPYESGVAVAEHLASGVLLTFEGDGHTIAFSGIGCIDERVVSYLVDLTPPEDGTRCPA